MEKNYSYDSTTSLSLFLAVSLCALCLLVEPAYSFQRVHNKQAIAYDILSIFTFIKMQNTHSMLRTSFSSTFAIEIGMLET